MAGLAPVSVRTVIGMCRCDRRAVAELAAVAVDRREVVHAVVRAEAPHRAGGGHQAGHALLLVPAGGDLRDAGSRVIHGHRLGAVVGRPVAELARLIRAPALRRARGRHRAGVVVPGRDRRRRRSRPDTVTGCVAVVVVPSPSSPVALLPQHLTRAAGQQRAGVVVAGRDLVATPPTGPVTCTGFRLSRLGAVADLAVLVLTPALDAAAGRAPRRCGPSRPRSARCRSEPEDVDGGACACFACRRRAGRCRCSPSTHDRHLSS